MPGFRIRRFARKLDWNTVLTVTPNMSVWCSADCYNMPVWHTVLTVTHNMSVWHTVLTVTHNCWLLQHVCLMPSPDCYNMSVWHTVLIAPHSMSVWCTMLTVAACLSDTQCWLTMCLTHSADCYSMSVWCTVLLLTCVSDTQCCYSQHVCMTHSADCYSPVTTCLIHNADCWNMSAWHTSLASDALLTHAYGLTQTHWHLVVRIIILVNTSVTQLLLSVLMITFTERYSAQPPFFFFL